MIRDPLLREREEHCPEAAGPCFVKEHAHPRVFCAKGAKTVERKRVVNFEKCKRVAQGLEKKEDK